MADTVKRYKRKAIWWSGKEWFMGQYDISQMEIFGCAPVEGTCPPWSGPPYGNGFAWKYCTHKLYCEPWADGSWEILVECIKS